MFYPFSNLWYINVFFLLLNVFLISIFSEFWVACSGVKSLVRWRMVFLHEVIISKKNHFYDQYFKNLEVLLILIGKHRLH